jgi:hypothetical protein
VSASVRDDVLYDVATIQLNQLCRKWNVISQGGRSRPHGSSQGDLVHLAKVVNETLRRPVANSSAHLHPATCHKILDKPRQRASRNQGSAFVPPDQVNVMCHSGNVVLQWIVVSFLLDTAHG